MNTPKQRTAFRGASPQKTHWLDRYGMWSLCGTKEYRPDSLWNEVVAPERVAPESFCKSCRASARRLDREG